MSDIDIYIYPIGHCNHIMAEALLDAGVGSVCQSTYLGCILNHSLASGVQPFLPEEAKAISIRTTAQLIAGYRPTPFTCLIVGHGCSKLCMIFEILTHGQEIPVQVVHSLAYFGCAICSWAIFVYRKNANRLRQTIHIECSTGEGSCLNAFGGILQIALVVIYHQRRVVLEQEGKSVDILALEVGTALCREAGAIMLGTDGDSEGIATLHCGEHAHVGCQAAVELGAIGPLQAHGAASCIGLHPHTIAGIELKPSCHCHRSIIACDAYAHLAQLFTCERCA